MTVTIRSSKWGIKDLESPKLRSLLLALDSRTDVDVVVTSLLGEGEHKRHGAHGKGLAFDARPVGRRSLDANLALAGVMRRIDPTLSVEVHANMIEGGPQMPVGDTKAAPPFGFHCHVSLSPTPPSDINWAIVRWDPYTSESSIAMGLPGPGAPSGSAGSRLMSSTPPVPIAQSPAFYAATLSDGVASLCRGLTLDWSSSRLDSPNADDPSIPATPSPSAPAREEMVFSSLSLLIGEFGHVSARQIAFDPATPGITGPGSQTSLPNNWATISGPFFEANPSPVKFNRERPIESTRAGLIPDWTLSPTGGLHLWLGSPLDHDVKFTRGREPGQKVFYVTEANLPQFLIYARATTMFPEHGIAVAAISPRALNAIFRRFTQLEKLMADCLSSATVVSWAGGAAAVRAPEHEMAAALADRLKLQVLSAAAVQDNQRTASSSLVPAGGVRASLRYKTWWPLTTQF